MAQDQDLEVPGPIVPATLATADDETHESADDEVEQGEHQPIVGVLIANRGFRPPRGEA